jgi:hypothetical protein
MSESAFAKYIPQAWPHIFHATMHVDRICGGVPSDARTAEGWIRSKLATTDQLIQAQVAEVMAERGVSAEEAAKVAADLRSLNGFKRDDQGLYIEGRQLKAAIKEAASVAAAAGKINMKGWGLTKKWILAYIAEHVFVQEDRLHLGVTEPTGVAQRFVHTRFGSGIQYEEYVDNTNIHFTIATDHDFTEEQWAMIWLTGGQQGIGATRSQGYGRYTITSWKQG